MEDDEQTAWTGTTRYLVVQTFTPCRNCNGKRGWSDLGGTMTKCMNCKGTNVERVEVSLSAALAALGK